MLMVGQKFPAYSLTSCVSLEVGKEFSTVDEKTYGDKWRVVFFWPMDFTFVCPTEIAEFGNQDAAFKQRGAQLLGVSTDTHFVHLAWRQSHPALKNLPFPMLADTKKELSQALGILHADGIAYRATYIVDPQGIVRWLNVNDLPVGRNVEEVIRALDALQTGALTPCNWQKGQKTL